MREWVRSDGLGVASVDRHGGEFVTLRSAASSPPGSTLKLRADGIAQPYEVKVRTCRRSDADGCYVIEGRWVNLSRVQRDALTASPAREA